MVGHVAILVVMVCALMRVYVHVVTGVDQQQCVLAIVLIAIVEMHVTPGVKDIVCIINVDLIVEEVLLLRLIQVTNVDLLLVRPQAYNNFQLSSI